MDKLYVYQITSWLKPKALTRFPLELQGQIA